MTPEFSEVLQRVVDKASKVANRNAELQSKVQELEEQIDHLQETLAALQAEHADFQDQLQQRNLALTCASIAFTPPTRAQYNLYKTIHPTR